MARISKEQKEIRIKALNEAIETLKELSSPIKNMVSFERVTDLANENYSKQLTGNISITSLKVPTSKEFREIKKKIVNFRNEHKNIKEATSVKSKSSISSLSLTVENLMIEVAKFYDGKLLLNEKIEAQKKTIEKIKNERDIYRKQLNELKAKYGH